MEQDKKQRVSFMTEEEIKQAILQARENMQQMTYEQQNKTFANFIRKNKKEGK